LESPLKKLASQTAVYGLSSIIGRLVNYLLTPLYTYSFLPHDYGIVVELYTYTSFLIVLLTFGMETAFFRFANSKENNDGVFSTSMGFLAGTTTLFVTFCLIFVKDISTMLHYQNHPEYISWFVWIVAIDIVTALPFAYLRKQNKALRFALIRLGSIFVNVAFNLFFILYCPKHVPQGTWYYSPETGVGYIFISNLISSVFTLVMLLPYLFKIRFGLNPDLLKKMLVYCIPLVFAGLAGMVNETMDRVLLKYLLTDKATILEQIGIYGACYKISIIMTLFVQTFRYAAEPFYFSHHNQTGYRELYARVMNYFVIICMLIFLVTLLFMDVIKLFIGEAYRSGLQIVPLLLLANMFLGIFYNLSIWYKLEGKTLYGAMLTGIGALITIVANVCLIPLMGYTGAAYATLICYASIMVLSWLMGQKHLPVPYQTGSFVVYLTSGIALYLGALWLAQQGVPYYFSGVACLSLFSGLALWKEKDLLSLLRLRK
jgi:O-antigen/teichoic acid export membrane protein